MAEFYPYLISSLPLLNFGIRPPLNFEKFLSLTKDFIPEQDYQLIVRIGNFQALSDSQENRIIKRYSDFERKLRNEMAKERAPRYHVPVQKYLRGEDDADAGFMHLAITSYRNPAIIEGERNLDLARWNYLEELSFGHFFDLELLVIYALKLKLLERWDVINNSDRQSLLEKILE